jgi:hypothetical protein
MSVAPPTTYSGGILNVRRKSIFWIGNLVVACLVSIGVGHADAGQSTATAKRTTQSSRKKPAPKPAYSATRSQSR